MKEYTLKPINLESDNVVASSVTSVLALDLGIGSFGIAFQRRSGKGRDKIFEFPIVRSCTLPHDWAELGGERTRRRMWRTRLAHKAREKWLREVFVQCGLGEAVLWGRRVKQVELIETGIGGEEVRKKRWVLDEDSPADYRLEREFPPHLGQKTRDGVPSDEEGARTIYCGAALRCLLLLGETAQMEVQGRVLEPWQVFKALHSAIQKRGYDGSVPWARTPAARIAASAKVEGKESKRTKQTEAEEVGVDAVVEISEAEKREQKEEQASLERAMTMKGVVESLTDDPRFHHPCFWEAYRMGLWDPAVPASVKTRLSHDAKSSKWDDQEDPANQFKNANERDPYARLPAIFPRQMVEAELLALCQAAGRLLPELAGRGHEIAYGPTGVPYPTIPRRNPAKTAEEERRRNGLAALPDDQRKKFVRGKEAEWQGALGQKAPTFDNRGPAPCVLIPRFNVAKCDLRFEKSEAVPDSILAAEVSFLLQAKNFRFAPEVADETQPSGFRDFLHPHELNQLYQDHFKATVLTRLVEGKTGAALTGRMLGNWLSTNVGRNRVPKPGQEGNGKHVIDMPKATGRSRFSRPALRLVKALLLSGLSPVEFKAAVLDLGNAAFDELRESLKLGTAASGGLNQDPMKGMIADDLKFLDKIGASWQKISIRDERLEGLNEVSQAEEEARRAAITRMISMEINPKIRHRLTLLDQLLDEVVAKEGVPERVVLEFAREEWLGPKRRKELMAFQEQRKQENITARLRLGGGAPPKMLLKHQLCDEQGHRCLFCGLNFSAPDSVDVVDGSLSFENAELAHIVADTKGGPRAYVNLVLACQACNRAQGTLYHAEAFAQRRFPREWDSFVADVQRCSTMRPFKKKILSTKSEDEAAEMVQNKTALQETAWIAKLARVLICLKFGWRLDSEGEERRIVVVTGSVTNRVAMRYGLYSLLGGPERVKELNAKKVAIDQALEQVEAAADEGLNSLGESLAKVWQWKKRKGDEYWERDYMVWLLRRLQIAAEESLNDKDRKDHRHHAVDAMILSFLPHWAGNPGKSLYFGLPPGRNWKEEFEVYVERLYPEVLIPAPPRLEDSFYGARRVGMGTVATKRYILRQIAYSGITPKFSNPTLNKRARNILDSAIREKVTAFAATSPKETQWLSFCQQLRTHGIRPGGPRVINVRCIVSEHLTEYADFSKDGTGAWRRGDKNQGWFVCEKKDKEGQYAIEPVYVHQSKLELEQRILSEGKYSRVVGFFERDEVVTLDREITGIKDPLPAGSFVIRTMKLNGQVELSNSAGYQYNPVSMKALMDAGFKRRKDS